MSKRARNLGTPGQLPLPLGRDQDSGHLAGAARTKEAIREALKQTLEGCALDRAMLAAEMSRLTGDNISEHAINTWVAESKSDRRFPLEYAAALAMITGNPSIIRAALRGTGFQIITSGDVTLLELGRLTAAEMTHRKRKRAVIEELRL